MAGKSIVLQPTQVVFKEGEPSNGMFIVRAGELEVYLEKDDQIISLASVSVGGMIGEMALFDQQPRSASVRAKVKTEVTHISNEDFAKLMKQIPKWFTALMGTLSSRLRVTNERLKAVEADLSGRASAGDLQLVLQMLHVFDLILHKDSTKEGKHWQLERQAVSQSMTMLYPDDMKHFNRILKVLADYKFLALTTNNYKVDVIEIANRGIITRLNEYISNFKKNGGEALSKDGLLLLKCLDAFGKNSGYETFTASLSELALEAQKMEIEEEPDWRSQLPVFKVIHEELKLTKTSDGNLGIKCSPKVTSDLLQYHVVITKFLDTSIEAED